MATDVGEKALTPFEVSEPFFLKEVLPKRRVSV